MELTKFSGPYSRIRESIVRIADSLDETFCRDILRKYGIDIQRCYSPCCQTMYYLFPLGTTPQETEETEYYRIERLKQICETIRSGEIEIDEDGVTSGEDE